MEKLTLLVGRLALALGIVAASCTFFFLIKPISICIIVALFCGLLGFMSSSAYVILNLRFRVNMSKVTPGMIGLFLSSAPVIYILILNALHSK